MLLEYKREIQDRRSFYEFSIDAFEVLNPYEKFVHNWHLQYLAEVLQNETKRIIEGRLKEYDLIINVPPRSLKSFLISIAWPAWAWIHSPSLKFISSSFADELSVEHNVLCRRIIESDWYQNRWGKMVKMMPDQNTKSKFEIEGGGSRRATSTGGSITGGGGNIIIIDDPQNPRQASSETLRETANKHFDLTLSTRLNNTHTDLFVIVMQRLHQNDLTGHLLAKGNGKFRQICLPAVKSDDIKPIELARFYEDDLLFKQRFNFNFLQDKKTILGPYDFAGQYQQRPSPEEGGMVKKTWFKFYDTMLKFDMVIQSWDLAFKEKTTSDYVAGQIWGAIGLKKYLIYAIKQKMDIIKTIESIISLSKRYPESYLKLIEDKANGPAVIQILKDKIAGLKEVNPETDKISRLNAIIPTIYAGEVYLPCITDPTDFNAGKINVIPKCDTWVLDFLESMCLFPNGENDDDVDACTQALNFLTRKQNVSINKIKIGGATIFNGL